MSGRPRISLQAGGNPIIGASRLDGVEIVPEWGTSHHQRLIMVASEWGKTPSSGRMLDDYIYKM